MDKKEALKYALEKLEISDKSFSKNKVTLSQFLDVISKPDYNLASELNYSEGGLQKLLNKVFPARFKGRKVCSWLLYTIGAKYCAKCNTVKHFEDFSLNKGSSSGYNNYCKPCAYAEIKPTQAARSSKRKALLLNRVPKWANLESISLIYSNCPSGYHVDHIVPLQGEMVCGLHVENNLQYLTAHDNQVKGNRL